LRLEEIAKRLGLRNLTPEIELGSTPDVRCGHASDLLSDILANAPKGGVLVTIQTHMNVVAVSVHADLAAVILASGRTPEEPVKVKSVENGIPLFISTEPTFDVVGQLYSLGVRGSAKHRACGYGSDGSRCDPAPGSS